VSYSGQSITVNWNPPNYGSCSGSPLITIQLTVVGSSGQTDSIGRGVNIDLRARGDREGLRTSFLSALSTPPGERSARGFIRINDSRVDETSSSGPATHVFRGMVGKNSIEAYTGSGIRGEAFWKFELSSADHFTPGSLRVETGTVAAMDGRAVTFRLSGSPGERVRFSFELSP
jgi:hypothetical protein